MDRQSACSTIFLNKYLFEVSKGEDDKHMVCNAAQLPTDKFPINYLVLVKYPKTVFDHKSPTKFPAIRQLPFRVVSFVGHCKD